MCGTCRLQDGCPIPQEVFFKTATMVSNQTVTAANLKLSDIAGRALVIHEGGDNYSDQPENAGGMGRIACGVIPKRAAGQ